MNKFVAYYSIIMVCLSIIACLFDSEGDSYVFLAGVMYMPVLYSLWEMTTELKIKEERDKIEDKIREEELIREEIKEELKKESIRK